MVEITWEAKRTYIATELESCKAAVEFDSEEIKDRFPVVRWVVRNKNNAVFDCGFGKLPNAFVEAEEALMRCELYTSKVVGNVKLEQPEPEINITWETVKTPLGGGSVAFEEIAIVSGGHRAIVNRANNGSSGFEFSVSCRGFLLISGKAVSIDAAKRASAAFIKADTVGGKSDGR